MAEPALVLPVDRSALDASRASNPLPARAQQEVKSAVHRELIDKADLEKLLYMQDTRGRQQLLGLDSATGLRTWRALQCQRAHAPGQRSDGRGLRPRAARAAAARPDDQRHPGEHLQAGLRRARRRARGDQRRLPGRPPPAAHHRADRREVGRRVDESRRWWTRACRTARASTPSFRRWRSTARFCRFAAFGTERLTAEDLLALSRADAADARVPATACRRG